MIITCPSCSARLRINEKALTAQNPFIKCVRCNSAVKVDLPSEPAPVLASEEKTFIFEPTEVGWVVVHDESTETQTVPLKTGKQTVGRASVSKPCEVMIQTQDRYMSRHHLIIEVVKGKDGAYKYWVSDHPDSTNPTFINTFPLKRGTILELVDGAIMQMGKTKVILKNACHCRYCPKSY